MMRAWPGGGAIEGVHFDEHLADDGYGGFDDLSSVMIENETLKDVDFSASPAKRWVAVGSRLQGCSFGKMRIDDFKFGSGMEMSEYVDCSFDGARIRSSVPGRARFVRCSFRKVNLVKWGVCDELEFVDCVFTGALRDVAFAGEILDERDKQSLGREFNEFIGNDFSDATLVEVAFRRGIDLTRQRLPERPGFLFLEEAESVLLHAMDRMKLWPASEEKTEAQIHLQVILDDVADGQWQILISPDDFVSKSGMKERAFAMLSELLNQVEAERVAGTLAPVDRLRDRLSTRAEQGARVVYFRAGGAGAARQVLDQPNAVVPGEFDSVSADGVEPSGALSELLSIARRTDWFAEIANAISIWPPQELAPRTMEEYEALPDDSPWKTATFALEQLGEDARDTLAQVADRRVPNLAEDWAFASSLAAYSDTTPETVLPILTGLVNLARRARDAGEQIFCFYQGR